MARARSPYSIYPKKRTTKAGKATTVYYYSLNPECGLPREICEQEQRKSTGKRRKSDAIEWILKERIPVLQREARKGEAGPTLREYLDPFYVPGRCPHMARLADDRRPITESWAADQRSRLKRFVFEDPIAAVPIRDLAPGDFEDWKHRALEENGIRTVNMTLSAIKASFAEGLHRGELRFDPTQVVSKVKETSQEQGIYSLKELRKIFVQHPEVWNYPKEYHGSGNGRVSNLMVYTFAFLFASTGERPGALLELRWKDVGDGEIEFRAEILKTGSERIVPLIPRVSAILNDLREEGKRVGDEDYVFGYSSGESVGYTWYRKSWERMMNNAKLPACDSTGLKRVPYSFKHSIVTHLIDEGADPVFVAELVGHSHGSGGGARPLTRVQARYKRRQAEKLRSEILPLISNIFSSTSI